MNSSIPKPTFPGPRRPRRSSIAQAAAANRGEDAAADEQQPQSGRPETADSAATRPVLARRPQKPSSDPRPPVGTTANSSKRLAQSRDILLSLPDELKLRMVNTIAWTTPYTGINQQQKFIRKAISELCDRLETQFNDGNTFPSVPD